MTPQVGTPIAGFYQTKLVRGGPWVAVRIWFGPPLDPVTKEELDRSHRWQAMRDGKLLDDVFRVWPYVVGHEIDEARYNFLLKKADWSVKNDPASPEASPTTPISHHHIKPVF